MSAIPNLPEQDHHPREHNLDAVLDKAIPSTATKRIDSPTNGTFASSNNTSSNFTLHDTPIENLRPLKVIVVGAGYSGIYHGIRIPERLRNVDLTIYDKNAGVGGTWFENRYPGCACDIPCKLCPNTYLVKDFGKGRNRREKRCADKKPHTAHSYQYSFNPNPSWSSMYSPASEIQAYLAATVKKYSVDRYIKLSHEIKSCTWDAAASKWKVVVHSLKEDRTFEDNADVLIMARGGLNHIAWPQIDGLRSFEGEVMHSADWNQEYVTPIYIQRTRTA